MLGAVLNSIARLRGALVIGHDCFSPMRSSCSEAFHILNLRSLDIIDDDGTPGRNFALARQKTANPNGVYTISPRRTGAYAKLPQPDTTYAS